MPDGLWLACLLSFVHSHLMVQERQQSYKVKASVAHKHFAKRLRRAVQQQRSCALLRAYGLCFWNFGQMYSRRLSSPAHIKRELELYVNRKIYVPVLHI